MTVLLFICLVFPDFPPQTYGDDKSSYSYYYDSSSSEACNEDYENCDDFSAAYIDNNLKRALIPPGNIGEPYCDPQMTGDEHCVCSGLDWKKYHGD